MTTYNVLLIIFMQIAIEACGFILLHNFIVSFFAYSAPLCNFIFKNRSIAMRTLLIFSLSLLRQNRL
jgi:hypothetical protein